MKTKKEVYEILNKIQLDDEIQRRIDLAETTEDIAEILCQNGAALSAADLAMIFVDDEEMQEEDLDLISGGCIVWILEKLSEWHMKRKTGKKHTCKHSPINGMVCKEKR